MPGRKEDLLGKRFGRLVVVGEASNSASGKVRWMCRCDCGNEIITTALNLKSGDTTSCGCFHKEVLHSKIKNLIGMKIGKLVVLDQIEEAGKVKCFCRCECGKEKWIPYRGLREERTQSCGCYSAEVAREKHTKHGFYGESLYNVHRTMKQRCMNPNSRDYKWYGARGVTVCPEWMEYPVFREWALSHGYKKGLTIERVDVNKGYDPTNCIWIPLSEQSRNKTNSLCNRGGC